MPSAQAWPSHRSVNWKAAPTCLIWAATLHNHRLDTCHKRRFRRHTSFQFQQHFNCQCHQIPLPSIPNTNRGKHSDRAVGATFPTWVKGEKRGSIKHTTAKNGSRTLDQIPMWNTTKVDIAATYLKSSNDGSLQDIRVIKPGSAGKANRLVKKKYHHNLLYCFSCRYDVDHAGYQCTFAK